MIEFNRNGIRLGLKISNSLEKLLYDGENKKGIQVESIYGEGSKFEFFVDLGSREEAKMHESNSSILLSPNSMISDKILLFLFLMIINLIIFVLENY